MLSMLEQAQTSLRAGDKRKAASLITSHLKQNPQDERGWLLLAACQTQLNKKAKCLEKALEINPKNQKARKALKQVAQGKQKQQRSFGGRRLMLYSIFFLAVTTLIFVAALHGTPLPPETFNPTTPPEPQQPAPTEPSSFFAPVGQAETTNNTSPSSPASAPTEIPLADIPEAYCIPQNTPRQKGIVTGIPSAGTLEILVGEETWIVKYIGIEVPALEDLYGPQALTAAQTLLGQSVVLIEDGQTQDNEGNQLRYVLVSDYFVNYSLLEWGMAKAAESETNTACQAFFLVGQNTAKDQQAGIWEPQDVRLDPNDWRNWPVVPLISENAKQIYHQGVAQGRNPNHFSIMGDCQAPQWRLFGRFDWNTYQLEEQYQYMQSTVDAFSGQWSREAVTVKSGNTVSSLYSVLWADTTRCESNESPIDCELRINQPSIALIMLGTNWKKGRNDEFDTRLRYTVEYLIDRNVVPVLITKADATEPDFPLNQIMAQIAYDYDIPLWNFWAAVQDMPNHGIDPDDVYGIHLLPKAYIPKRMTGLETLHTFLGAVSNP